MRRWLVCSGALPCLLSLAPARADVPTAPQQIGSWVLECPAGRPDSCTMRNQTWILPPGGTRPGAALEVQARGDMLVPVVALRGLSTQAALGGVLTLQAQVGLRLDNGPRSELACGLDNGAILCAPQGAAVAATAAALPNARNAAVQIQLSVPGMVNLPPQDRSLDLSSTREALARYRALGPAGEALPAEPGLDWVGFLDRVLRAAGIRNGAAELLPTQAGFMHGKF